MMKSDTGKTIEQYRDIIKQLKIKVIKQKERIEELEYIMQTSKSKIPSPMKKETKKGGKIDADQSFNLSGDTQVMQNLFENAKELGLTLEMLFRAADIEGQKQILLDDFRIFLNKLNIGLDHQQITRLLYIFDEDCSGTLTYLQYYDVLASYQVNSEQMKEKDKTRGQEALLRFINYLQVKNISDNDAFKLIDKSKLNKFTADQLSEFLKKQIDGFPRSMRTALYNYFDYEDKQFVTKDTFLEVLDKIRKSPLGSNKQSITQQMSSSIPQQQQQQQKGQSTMKQTLKEKVLQVKKKFETNSKTAFTKILEFAVQKIQHPERGLLYNDIQMAAKALQGNLQPDECFAIFRLLDSSQNGVVYYDECSLFFQEFKTQDKSDYIFFIINLARELQSQQITSKQFLQNNQIEDADTLDEGEFTRKAGNLFKIYQQDSKYHLFSVLYKRLCKHLQNPPSISGQQLIQLLDSYRPDVVDKVDQNPHVKTKKRKEKETAKKANELALSQLKSSQVNENEVEKELRLILKQLKPSLSDDDYFTTKDKKTWKTIFTNELACLKFCLDTCSSLDGGAKWVDQEFGYNKNEPDLNLQSLYFYENMVPSGSPAANDIQWLSLAEINRDQECKFFDDGATANDVMQSSFLGDCWFVSALSIMATHDELLQGEFKPTIENLQTPVTNAEAKKMTNGVYPYLFQYFAKYGMYPMRFFKNYKWHYVVIDDRLPTLLSGELLHGKCRPDEGFVVPDEYWVSLIEKAYAKLHNCYQSMFSGFIDEALEDMTGYAAEKRQIFEGKLQTQEEKDEFWNLLKQYTKDECMIGCSANGGTEQNIVLDGEDTGLKSGHAYAILDVFEFKHECKNTHQNSRLLRMRNPWGFGEWKLKWADNDDKLEQFKEPLNNFFNEYVQNKIKLGKDVEKFTAQEEDGTFLICFKEDYLTIYLCHQTFQMNELEKEYKINGLKQLLGDYFRFPTNRTQEEFSQYASNPQFFINIKRKDGKKTQLFISCGQYDGRLYRGIKYPYKEVIHPSSLMFWKLENGEKKLEKFEQTKLVQHSGSIKTMREICIPKFQIENGNYIIIPSAKSQGSVGEFTINIYFDCNPLEIDLGKVDDPDKLFQLIQEEEENNEYEQKYLDLLTIRKKLIS